MKPDLRAPSETGVWQLPEPAWEHPDTLPVWRGHPCPSIPTPSGPRHPRAASKTSSKATLAGARREHHRRAGAADVAVLAGS